MQPHVRFGATLLSAALVLTACSDDGITPIEDPPDASGEPTEPDPPPEEPEEPEDPEPEIFQGQLYPPLPDDLEPDPVAGDIESQEQVLAILPGYYDGLESSFSTNTVEPGLEDFATSEHLEAIENEVAAQVDQGVVSVSPDGEVGWVEVIAADPSEVALGICVDYGPETGAYDPETGDKVSESGSQTFVRVFTFGSVGEGSQPWLVTQFSSQGADGGSCDELR